MELLRELYHVLLTVAFFVSSTLGAKDKELYCGGEFYMPIIINFRLQLNFLRDKPSKYWSKRFVKKCPFFKQIEFGKITQKWQGKDLNQG